MPNKCRGICDRYCRGMRHAGLFGPMSPAEYVEMYRTYRRCSTCETTMAGYESRKCQCCGAKLQCKPRNTRARKNLNTATVLVMAVKRKAAT